MPARVQFYFQEEIALCGLDEGVFKTGFLAALGDIGFVLRLVPDKKVCEDVGFPGRFFGREGPVGLMDFSLSEHVVQPLQGFGSFGKERNAAHRPVQPMRNAHEYLSRLFVPLGDEGLQRLAQRLVSRFVSLHNLSRAFVEDQQVIVLIEDSALDIPEFIRIHFSVNSHAAKILFFLLRLGGFKNYC